MIFGYSIEEAKKTVVAFLVAAIALAGYFVAFDPGFNDAAIAVVIAGFNTLAVFAATNHTVYDVQKAVQALTGSTLGLVGLFVTVDPGTAETILGVALALVNVYAVYVARNTYANTNTQPVR